MDNPGPKPLVGEPARQAHATIGAFDYQLWQTVYAWLRLKPDEFLYVEGAEDFDVVTNGDATATQVKAGKTPLTLNSSDVRKAVRDYWTLAESNTDRAVRYIFLSRAGITMERERQSSCSEPLLKIWQRGARLDSDLMAICAALESDTSLPSSLVQLLKSLDLDAIRQRLIHRITWSAECEDASSIERRVDEYLVAKGEPHGVSPTLSKRAAPHLYREVVKAAREKGAKPLTLANALETFESVTRPDVSQLEMQTLRRYLAKAQQDPGAYRGNNSSARVLIRGWRLGAPPLDNHHAPRSSQILTLSVLLKVHAALCVHGSTGMGKTTIANLLVREIPGSWLWWTGRGLSPEEIRSSLRILRQTLRDEEASTGIVLDDLELAAGPARSFECELIDLIYDAQSSGMLVILTATRPPATSISDGLGWDANQTTSIEPFVGEDVIALAMALGCPDPDILRTFVDLIIGATSGHPQLIHAQLLALKREQWQASSVLKLCSLSEEALKRQSDARSLVADLPAPQRHMLYRLSMISCPFTLKHTLRLGDLDPLIPEPGLQFEQLAGPWIESLHDGYYRVSPLLRRMGAAMLSADQVRILHSAIAGTLWTRSPTDFEAASAFHHAWQASDEALLTYISAGLSDLDAGILKILGFQMAWFITIRLGPAEQLFTNNGYVSVMLRLLQFRLASSVTPYILVTEVVFARLEEEFLALPKQTATRALSVLIGTLPWLTTGRSVSARTMLRCLDYVLNNQDALDDDPEWDHERSMLADVAGVPKLPAAEQFVTFTPAWCTSIAELCEWMDALENASEDIRIFWFRVTATADNTSNWMVERAWLDESEKTSPNWPVALNALRRLVALADSNKCTALRIAGAVGQAVILQEYLDDSVSARLVLEGERKRSNNASPLIIDRLARLEADAGRHENAIALWDSAFDNWNLSRELIDTRLAFAAIQSAISAGKLDRYDRAVELLNKAADCFAEKEQPDLLIGAKADLGMLYYRLGMNTQAFASWASMLTLIERQFTISDGFHAFAIRKAAGHIITWVFGTVCTSGGSPLMEPPICFASKLNPIEKIKELGETDWEAVWVELIGIGVELDEGEALGDAVMPRLLMTKSPVVRTLAWMIEVHRSLAFNKLCDLPEKIFCWTASITETQHSGLVEGLGVSSYSPDHEGIGRAPFLAALLISSASGKNPQQLISAWKESACRIPWKDNLVPWFETIERLLALGCADAMKLLKERNLEWADRGILALSVCCSPGVSPQDAAIAQYHLLVVMYGDTMLRRRFRNSIVRLFSDAWRRYMKTGALFVLPRVALPQLEAALASSEIGFAKAVVIVIAGAKGVGLRIPQDVLDQLRTMNG